jgi:endonuclease/exonuclease/phosphatase family metal-dependent hydrolase
VPNGSRTELKELSLMIFGRLGHLAALRAGFLLGALGLTAPIAVAQTTATLEVSKDATIRGGSYASTRYGGDGLLVTRSSDDDSYVRRAVLTFDTETTIPEEADIASATLVLTVRGGNSETRELSAHAIPVSFDEDDVTWTERKSGLDWSHEGGEVTGTPSSGIVRSAAGSQTSFDVTPLVQKVVNGDFGSRYARFLVSDPGRSSRDSYKEFYSSEASDRARRPRLIVEYGSGGASSPEPSEEADAAGDLVLTPASVSVRAGKWVVEPNTAAIGGSVVRHPNAGLAKISAAQASPANYFEMTFTAEAGKPYRIWLHGRADGDHWANDSVYVQFSGSVTQAGSSVYRIGSTSAAEINLEDCSGCSLNGWAWQDNGYGLGKLGPQIYFASSGTQTIRIQTREDGLAIDRIVLSPVTYLTAAPDTAGETVDPIPAESTATSEILLAPAAARRAGKWVVGSDASAVGGNVVRHPDAGAAKVSTAAASPANYFEMTFSAVAGMPYRLWLHGKADRDAWSNDSVHVQFSGSVTQSGSAIYRIGTSSSTEINLEECSGCGISGWVWEDNGYGSRGKLGPAIYFATTGTQTIRVQTREDGLAVDQIRLSPAAYLTTAPPKTSESSVVVDPDPEPEPEPEPEPTPTTTSTLKVLHWNIQHGTNLSTIATWIAKWKPDVISLNEIEKFNSYGNIDQPQVLADKLKASTGITYYVHFAQRYGYWTSAGQGNAILSRYKFAATGRETISYGRSIAIATIVVNGRSVSVMSVHLDADSTTRRETQVREIQSLASTWSDPRIIAGDFNAWPDHYSIDIMSSKYYDSWAIAEKNGTASSFPGNSPFGATKNGRIDYIWHSHGSTVLAVKSSQVPDTRNSSGSMPSDHRPVITIYQVK